MTTPWAKFPKVKAALKEAGGATDRLGRNRKERRTQIDGYWFDSGHEAELYLVLKGLLAEGKYTDLKCQDVLYLTNARFMMKPDFRVTLPSGKFEWHEFKGNYESDVWLRNTRLWRAGYGPHPGAKLVVWKMGRGRLGVWKVLISGGGAE